MTFIIAAMVLIFLSPATLLLSARILGVYEATLVKCFVTSILFGLIMVGYEFVAQWTGIANYEWLDDIVAIVLGVLIISWQLQIGYVRSFGLGLLWGILIGVFLLILVLALGFELPDWADKAIANTQNAEETSEQSTAIPDEISTDSILAND